MPKPKKPIKAFRHKAEKRAHIPSAEEAGYESASAKVQGAPEQKEFPRNPIVHRGQDPELYWLNKYGADDREDQTSVDIRSLYRHEHIAPECIIKGLYRLAAREDAQKPDLTGFTTDELFGNAISHEELDKVSDYYTHSDGWTNRLIQGDSLLAMTSLLEREGMAGQVQCFYFDPPYGIKYGSNWQLRLNNRTVTDGQDDSLSGEPEQIKAFRDTWELGIHSYLSYLRDRLLVARELLHESGSCFVQISDENVHLVRCLMDEVFGSGNFVSLITVQKTTSSTNPQLSNVADFLLWYGRNKERMKYRELLKTKAHGGEGASHYNMLELPDGIRRSLTPTEKSDPQSLPKGSRFFTCGDLQSAAMGREKGEGAACWFPVEVQGKSFLPSIKSRWKTNEAGMERLKAAGRLIPQEKALRYIRYLEDFPAYPLNNVWADLGGASDRLYVVQTNRTIAERCMLMTTDPGDLVVDPTAGSGTTAFVAEQWGRRWITIDTSRIALNIAKTRLMTGTFPYYQLYDQQTCDLRQGFIYKKVPHITLGSIANNEPAEEETLYDQPLEDKKRLRVAGPFTVETLQNYEPISPEELARQREAEPELAGFEDGIFEELRHAGVKTGDKQEAVEFTRIDRLSDARLHAEGWYVPAHKNGSGDQPNEKKAYLYIGPKFGTVSKQAVNEAIKACRDKRDGDWLLILGFSFESGLQDITTRDFGSFRASIVRMHDDLLQQGLLKRVAKSASFVTIGEPDIRLKRSNGTATVEIAGLDIYDPVKDEVKSRDVHDINYWMLDDNYDGSNFVVRQVFFCGGDKDEFNAWKKGLSNLALAATKKKAEQTLKIEIDDEAFASAYGHISRAFKVEKGQKIAVRVISQFGEETTKILTVR
ncbi:MAG: site-specific DNA-methyltransferase [Chthoniobacterales bacterium]